MPWKDADQRIQDTVEYIRTLDASAATLVERRFERVPAGDAKKMSEAMSLGKEVPALDKDEAKEKVRRHAIRAILLLELLCKKQPIASAKGFIAKYQGQKTDDLAKTVRSNLPAVDDAPERDAWDPKNFTDPKAYAANKPFKFIVWGMMNAYTGRGVSYETILKDPTASAKTSLMSTSIIDQDHRATYYPYGFILKVPQQNIISTHSKDQAFKNYKSVTEGMTAVEAADMLGEVRRVAATYKIDTPAKILAGTTGKGGSYGYNEVVVMGLSPEGKFVEVVGSFVKVKADGTSLYVREPVKGKPEKAPFVSDKIMEALEKLEKDKKIPIVKIVDTVV
jgi:hypothetical protein